MNIKGKIIKAFFLLTKNPQLFFKLLVKRLCYPMMVRWFLPGFSVEKKIKGVRFEFDFNLDPNIKKMYFGCYETETIETMRAVLKPGDIFIDVGANIGYLSCVGAGLVGRGGQVHSFEPVPQYFQRLEKMAKMNPDYKIIVNQYALGEKEGIANISVTNLQNIGWCTMVSGSMRKETIKETLDVRVYRLDNYIRQKALKDISLIKIDVEGFEFLVLKGLGNYFEDTNHRPIIICEIKPFVYSLLGCTLIQLLEYMKKYNYSAYNIVDANTKIDITRLEDITNVIFISYEK